MQVNTSASGRAARSWQSWLQMSEELFQNERYGPMIVNFRSAGKVVTDSSVRGDAHPTLVASKSATYSPFNNPIDFIPSVSSTHNLIHTTIGCGKQGFPSAQPYLSHTPVS
ncbi:hypothetical protein N7465_003942 [Penicillium sp. CMV-2018d]|nr:hypothetical protein N7465_003942 [Penicillium sp. CMV-2018d]